MSASEQPTRFVQSSPPDESWLARQQPEPILDPDLPIIDTHHHLWDRPQHRYLLDEFLADVRTGHRIVATVFEECHSMYRAGGPEELRSVGETEFVAGVAAMSASGLYGPTRVAAGIVGFGLLQVGGGLPKYATIKGIDLTHEMQVTDLAGAMVSGSIDADGL